MKYELSDYYSSLDDFWCWLPLFGPFMGWFGILVLISFRLFSYLFFFFNLCLSRVVAWLPTWILIFWVTNDSFDLVRLIFCCLHKIMFLGVLNDLVISFWFWAHVLFCLVLCGGKNMVLFPKVELFFFF